MRIRKEAKILKNHHREAVWLCTELEEGDYIFPKSRYKPSRLWTAHCRLLKACRRRYLNKARRSEREGDMNDVCYCVHQANSPNLASDAYRWWNIPEM